MEKPPTDDDDQQRAEAQDESTEEFKEDVENDPSLAPSPDEDAERLRGG